MIVTISDSLRGYKRAGFGRIRNLDIRRWIVIVFLFASFTAKWVDDTNDRVDKLPETAIAIDIAGVVIGVIGVIVVIVVISHWIVS